MSGLFKPLPVRRKELERNAKYFVRESTHAIACTCARSVHEGEQGCQAHCSTSDRWQKENSAAACARLWRPKALEHLVELEVRFAVEVKATVLRRQGSSTLINGRDIHSSCAFPETQSPLVCIWREECRTAKREIRLNSYPVWPVVVPLAFACGSEFSRSCPLWHLLLG
ncbi:hypothetical protein C8Q74DRAFT_344750 [Fomes fomentarius]|nr:hypothetical protein C8Q74DRAFT_344750 [Fomes fomentarius]